MKKVCKKTIFASAMALSLTVAPLVTNAQGYDELIYHTNVEIEELNQEQAALYQELASAYAEIESFNEEANKLVSEVAQQDKTIAELAREVEALQKVIDKRESLLAEQARSVQETGGSQNYLNYIASSKDISDFVGRIDVVRKMVSSNKELLDQQIKDKEHVEAKKADAQANKQEKIRKMADLEKLKDTASTSVAEKEDLYLRLMDDISLAQTQRDALVEEKTAFEESQRLAVEQAAQFAAQAHQEASEIAEGVESNEVYQEIEVNDVTTSVTEDSSSSIQESTYTEKDVPVETTTELSSMMETTTEIDETTSAPTTETLAITEATTVEEINSSTVSTEKPVVEETSVPETTQENVIEGPAGDITYQEPSAEEIAESERLAAEQAEAERLAEEQAESERLAAEQSEAEQLAEETSSETSVATAPSGNLLGNAAKYIGTPYVWGGKSPSGFDCSGFVQYVYRETYGVDIGGWTGAQESAGARISVADAQAGDLYFWGSPGGSYHVAIATGGGQYIHASQPGTPLGYSSIQSFTPDFAVRIN